MKKILAILTLAMVLFTIVPMVAANSVGGSTGIVVTTEKFKPLIWMCDNRAVIDGIGEPGRIDGKDVHLLNPDTCEKSEEKCITECLQGSISVVLDLLNNSIVTFPDATQIRTPLLCRTLCTEEIKKFPCYVNKGPELVERIHNYAFEGERVEWLVLVMDKNKIEEVQEVVATLGSSQGTGNDKEVECQRLNGFAAPGEAILASCNARIQEEKIKQFDPDTMSYYECTFTVETPASMHGEYFLTVEVQSVDGSAIMAENEFWFLNPTIALSVSDNLAFEDVRPGTDTYSQTILVGNDAEAGSGVTLDMFISGTNFYDPSSSGARCPYTNELDLMYFRYFATNGAYSTQNDDEVDDLSFLITVRDRDLEGYVNIQNTFESFSTKMYNEAEIIQDGATGGYYAANTLNPGSEMALTFKLSLPEPCVGDFSEGKINFWGEAI